VDSSRRFTLLGMFFFKCGERKNIVGNRCFRVLHNLKFKRMVKYSRIRAIVCEVALIFCRQIQLLQDPISFTESIVTSSTTSGRGLRLEPLFDLSPTPDCVIFQMFNSAIYFAFQVRGRVAENMLRNMSKPNSLSYLIHTT